MSNLHIPRVNGNSESVYARPEDFEEVFAEWNTDLLRLSLELTADAERAETCVILAMRDCFFRSSVSRDRAHVWARRMVIRNAIRAIWGSPTDILDESGFEFHLQPQHFRVELLRDSVAILTLPKFDRLALVICVLERYSILDCALMLRKTPQEVHDAMVRATERVLSIEQSINDGGAMPSRVSASGAITDGGRYLKGSCGSILDNDCQ